MKIELGSGHGTIEIPQKNLDGIILPRADKDGKGKAEAEGTRFDIFSKVMEVSTPWGLGSFLDNAIEEKEEVLVVINDANRPTPSYQVLESLLPRFEMLPGVRIALATGSHAPPAESELRQLLGNTYTYFRETLHIHTARDIDAHRYYGTTSRGSRIFFDRILDEVRNILIIGSVEPHYFAGYTGGRKSLLPGLSVYETIENNHAFSLDPKASLLNLDGNPVHLDMVEACGFVKNKNIYSIQLVLDGENEIHRAFGGTLEDSFGAGREVCRKIFTQPIDAQADIVVAVAEYPMDISLYQSQKAMENAKLGLREGGVMIFVSATRQGIGDTTFSDLLSSSRDLEIIKNKIRSKYVLGYQKTAKFIDAIENYNMFLVTSLQSEVVEQLHMKPFSSVQEALDAAFMMLPDPRVLVMPRATALVPLKAD